MTGSIDPVLQAGVTGILLDNFSLTICAPGYNSLRDAVWWGLRQGES